MRFRVDAYYLLANACIWSERDEWFMLRVRKNGAEVFNGGAWSPEVRKAIELAA